MQSPLAEDTLNHERQDGTASVMDIKQNPYISGQGTVKAAHGA